ncbi:parathyroid hormone-like hormone a isoform X1 [Pimephales promelas]|uniref:parathyroid hormone-like hormone a isoform X1 n=2 Tax=Pimephales promelas TaxID=90988 RepID=UPI001955DF62|nr:parathyroid hormone-like hormone a isoform X1 [Pimephales promelas]
MPASISLETLRRLALCLAGQKRPRHRHHCPLRMRMVCTRRALQHWVFALFLLCSPVPHHGRPVDALSSRIKRSVTHAQLMHDKGRTLQDFKRRLWLQELLHEVHTAEIREAQQPRGGVSSGGGGGFTVAVPMGVGVSMGTGTAHPKPAGGTKNLPISFRLEDEEGTNLPQETNKSQTYKESTMKAIGKRKKKGRVGKRRDGEKRKRRARSLEEFGSGFHLEWAMH